MKKVDLPETLSWYRDAAKWILGLSLGALGAFVGLAGFSEKISNAGCGPKIVFIVGCLSVIGATISGVAFNLHIAGFGNLLEREQSLKDESKAKEIAAENDNASIEAKLRRAEELVRIKTEKAKSETSYGRAYWALLFCFLACFIAFTIIGLWLLFTPSEKKESPITWAAIVNESIAKNPQQTTVHSVNFAEWQNRLQSITVLLEAIKNELSLCCEEKDQPMKLIQGGCNCPNGEPKCAHPKSPKTREPH